MLKTFVQQGRRRVKTGGVHLGYVEDFDEPRTKLVDAFSILLGTKTRVLQQCPCRPGPQ